MLVPIKKQVKYNSIANYIIKNNNQLVEIYNLNKDDMQNVGEI